MEILRTRPILGLSRGSAASPDKYNRKKNQESAKGAGGKGARVINCHNFFFTPDRETRRIDHTTTEGTAERKMRQFATSAPFTPAPLSALLKEWAQSREARLLLQGRH